MAWQELRRPRHHQAISGESEIELEIEPGE